MFILTKTEEILLLAIWQLAEDAYGVRIRQHVSDLIGKEFTYGNLYSALNQLVNKKYVIKKVGDPTPDRRGRPKAFYSISSSGLEALNTAREMNEALWGSVSKYAFK